MRTLQFLALLLSCSFLFSCAKPDVESVEHWKPWLQKDGRTLAVSKLLNYVKKYDDEATKAWRTSQRLDGIDAFMKTNLKNGKLDDDGLTRFWSERKSLGLTRALFDDLGVADRELSKITLLESQKEDAAAATQWVENYNKYTAGRKDEYVTKALAAEKRASELADSLVAPLVEAYAAKNSQKVFLRAFAQLVGFFENRAGQARTRGDEKAAKDFDAKAKDTVRRLSPAYGQALKDYTESDGARLAAATVIRFKLTADHVKTAEQIINDTSAPHTNVMAALDILVESPPDINAVPALVRILDQDPDKRPIVLAELAAKILGGLKAQEAVDGLINCLWRTDAYGRNAAPECRVALTQLGPNASYDKLVETLKRQNTQVEARAMQYGFKDKGAIEAKVADLLGQLGNKAAIPVLMDHLVLNEIPPGCERFLEEQEEKESLVDKQKTKEGRCKAEQQEFLEDTYFSKKKEECIQLKADYVLGQTERFLQVTKALARLQADEALPKLLEFAKAESSALQVKQAVVEQMAIMGSAKGVPLLLELLKDSDAFILPKETELAKLGEESPNAKRNSDLSRSGLIRAIHDHRQKVLSTAVRISKPGKTKNNDSIAKQIAKTITNFEKYKAQNQSEIDEFEAGRADWESIGAQAYIERVKGSHAWKAYKENRDKYANFELSFQAAQATSNANANDWRQKADALAADLKTTYSAYLTAKKVAKAAQISVLEKELARAKGDKIKATEEALKKSKASLEGFTGEIAEVAKDAERVINQAKKDAKARLEKLPKRTHPLFASTTEDLKTKSKACEKKQTGDTAAVTYESCLAKPEKSKVKPKPKDKKAEEAAQACKDIAIVLDERPTPPSKKRVKKKPEVPKLEKVKKEYDLKISFRQRNVDYFDERIKRYSQLSSHLGAVQGGLSSSKLDAFATATIAPDLSPEEAAAEAKLPREQRKKARAARRFKKSLAVNDRLFTAYRLLNAQTSAANVDKILSRLEEKEDAVFEIYLHGASRHASKSNVAKLRALRDTLREKSKTDPDERKRKNHKLRAQQILSVVEKANQRK